MKFNIPGAFWVALVVALVPAVQAVIMQFFPEADYWWSALLVTGLAAIAKSVQLTTQGSGAPLPGIPTAVEPSAPAPAAAPTVPPSKPASFITRLLFS